MMKLSIATALLVCGLGTTALVGCHPHEPTAPAAGLQPPVDPPKQPDLGHYPARVSSEVLSMYWGDQIMTVCKGPSPFFEFDSSKVGADDRPTMQLLADCMKSGPLAGKNIELVGRTDPRGTAEYNEQLGKDRAERVKAYLVSQGIEDARITTTSLGKTDASPMPKDWPGDRRVEIRLAK